MNEGVVRAVIEETIKRVDQRHRDIHLLPGTVVDGTDPMAVRVTVDGDSVAAATDDAELSVDGVFVQSIIGTLIEGDRVMLAFYPPSGCLIIGQILDTSWQFPTLLGTWSQQVFWRTVRWRKEPGNIIRVEGVVTGGTIGSTIFTLPEGARPSEFLAFACDDADNFNSIHVEPDGDVQSIVGNTRVSLFFTFVAD